MSTINKCSILSVPEIPRTICSNSLIVGSFFTFFKLAVGSSHIGYSHQLLEFLSPLFCPRKCFFPLISYFVNGLEIFFVLRL